jgi:hypothetical protein
MNDDDDGDGDGDGDDDARLLSRHSGPAQSWL